MTRRVRTFRIPPQLPGVLRSSSVLAGVAGLFIAMMFDHVHLPDGRFALTFFLKGAFFVCLVAAYFALRMKITVGADGVLARDPLRSQFVPFADVAGVSTYVQRIVMRTYIGVALELRDGSTRRFVVGRLRSSSEEAERIAKHIRDAFERSTASGPLIASAALARGGRSVRDWVSALRAVGAGANVDLRTPPVSPETLWTIVEDPRAPQPDRASAAVALGAQLDDAGRTRLRVAAEETAAPKLRVALEAVVAADDARVGGALEEIEREHAR